MEKEIEIYGIIYVVENKFNQKMYVGQTTRNLKQRWNGHCNIKSSEYSILSKAINKHGKCIFLMYEIDQASSKDELNLKEQVWINYLNTLTPFGYNQNSGGDAGKFYSCEIKEKMSESGSKAWSSDFLRRDTLSKLSFSRWDNLKYKQELSDAMRGSKGGKYKGTSWRESKNKWRVWIKIDNNITTEIHIKDETDAARIADYFYLKFLNKDGKNLNFDEIINDETALSIINKNYVTKKPKIWNILNELLNEGRHSD